MRWKFQKNIQNFDQRMQAMEQQPLHKLQCKVLKENYITYSSFLRNDKQSFMLFQKIPDNIKHKLKISYFLFWQLTRMIVSLSRF